MSKIGIQHPFTLISPVIAILFATILAIFFKQKHQASFSENTSEMIKVKALMLLMFYLSLVTLSMPLHEYDHVILIPLFALLWVLRWQFTLFLLPGLLLVSRSGNIAHYLQRFIEKGEQPALITGKMIASFGTLWIALFCGILFFWFTNEFVQKQNTNLTS
jgi:hypothetical protein